MTILWLPGQSPGYHDDPLVIMTILCKRSRHLTLAIFSVPDRQAPKVCNPWYEFYTFGEAPTDWALCHSDNSCCRRLFLLWSAGLMSSIFPCNQTDTLIILYYCRIILIPKSRCLWVTIILQVHWDIMSLVKYPWRLKLKWKHACWD
jgi:hypothetical protein